MDRDTGPASLGPPDECAEEYAHGAVCETVHGGIEAAIDDREGVNAEKDGEDGECLL